MAKKSLAFREQRMNKKLGENSSLGDFVAKIKTYITAFKPGSVIRI
jgi:hypothetical protein